MKAHTVNGDEFLKGIPIDQNEGLMIIAHEICRHHHERYDGGGYPDGLSGDEIPISAQAVSIADVYDALTSERCYKEAFSHEKAIEMILGGECGAFNPLLLECLSDISNELLARLGQGGEYDWEKTSYLLTSEVLENEELPSSERNSAIAEEERIKKEFFADRCGGIQFEYDATLRHIRYISYYNQNGEKTILDSATRLLNEEDWNVLDEKVNLATRQNPDVEMTVLVSINSRPRWHRLVVRTLWTSNSSSYVAIFGQLTDIHNELMRGGIEFMLDDKCISGETMLAMNNIFDVVRLVNPNNCEAMTLDRDGKMIEAGQKCFQIWNRNEPCQNCTSETALQNKKWTSKLEVKDGLLYSVLSRYVQCNNEDYVLEVAFCIDDSFEKAHNEIGFYPDSMALKNYYRDTLAKTYSRAYLESFMPNLENSKGVAIADIDEFKSINDTCGHIAGDTALKPYFQGNKILHTQGGCAYTLRRRRISAHIRQHIGGGLLQQAEKYQAGCARFRTGRISRHQTRHKHRRRIFGISV